MIHKCTCDSPYQDKKYGKGNRVFNHKGRGSKTGGVARCTVCGYILQDLGFTPRKEKPDVV